MTETTQNTSSSTPEVSPGDGPIAVTGASGYIGSWTVYDLMEQGYSVRACVRDTGNPIKVDHLLAMNDNPDLAGTKVIIVSGVVNREEIDELLQGGADDFVKKPFNINDLVNRVAELLEV